MHLLRVRFKGYDLPCPLSPVSGATADGACPGADLAASGALLLRRAARLAQAALKHSLRRSRRRL